MAAEESGEYFLDLMIRRARESIGFQPVREGFPSEHAFPARFSHFSVSLTSPSGRKYIAMWSSWELHRSDGESAVSWKKQIPIRLISLLNVLFFFVCCSVDNKIDKIIENNTEVILNHHKPYQLPNEKSSFSLKEWFSINPENKDIQNIGLFAFDRFIVDSQSNIYILDSKPSDNHILKFDKEGRFVRSFGRKGQGPGEIQYIRYCSINAKDELGILDDRNQKYLIFNDSAEVIHEIHMDRSIASIDILNNGNRLIRKTATLVSGEQEVNVILCDPQLNEIRTIDKFKSHFTPSGKINGLPMNNVVRITKNYIYIGSTDRGYDIWVYDLNGKLMRRIKKEFSEVEVLEEYKINYLKPYNRPELALIRSRIYFPKSMPPYQTFFVDDHDRLFVMTFESGSNTNEYLYDVFNPQGVFMKRIGLDNYGHLSPSQKGYYDLIARNGLLCYIKEEENGNQKLVINEIEWR
ncbi:MAG: 6-bladed beta-propeller [Desulfobacteraceae bacterium]|nr:MAG: 6-bladed beta-propeller [Desulfobacteraceae bacterium]